MRAALGDRATTPGFSYKEAQGFSHKKAQENTKGTKGKTEGISGRGVRGAGRRSLVVPRVFAGRRWAAQVWPFEGWPFKGSLLKCSPFAALAARFGFRSLVWLSVFFLVLLFCAFCVFVPFVVKGGKRDEKEFTYSIGDDRGGERAGFQFTG
jgi:hypothetical protein